MANRRTNWVKHRGEQMRARLLVLFVSAAALAAASLAVSPAGARSTAGGRSIAASGLTSPQGGFLGSDIAGVQNPEFIGESEGDQGPTAFGGSIVNRSFSKHGVSGPSTKSAGKAKSNPSQNLTFAGLNHR